MRTWLKEKRIQSGYTQRQMAEIIQVAPSYYCAIEKGTRMRNLPPKVIASFSVTLDMDIEEIIKLELEV